MIVVSCPDCGKHLLWHLAHEHRCDKQPQKRKKPDMVRCAMCDEFYPLHLAREHKCQNIRPKRKPSAKPVPQTASSSNPSPSSRRIETVKPPEPVKHPDVKQAGDVKHVKQLPAGDRAVYMREYMRAYQRKHRARQKAPE